MASSKSKVSTQFLLPGKWLSGGIAWAYLSALVIVPLAVLGLAFVQISPAEMVDTLQSPRVLVAFKLTVLISVIAALVNLVFGLIIAWVLVRYEFWGKSVVNLIIDLPFALPTSVAGIALTAAFSPNAFLGETLANWGIKVAYHPLGIGIALVFVGIPFVVRYVSPVLEEFDNEMEQAAHLLGAKSFQIITKIIFPTIFPAAMAGFTAAFARGLGEYGSIIFISGNLPMKTEVVSTVIVTKLEQFDYNGAVVIAVAMLLISFAVFGASSALQFWHLKRIGSDNG